MSNRCLLLLSCLCLGSSAQAQGPEDLPTPRPLEAPVVVLPPSYYEGPRPPRLDSREVWQYYGVDRFGHFRPRVILSPHGAYYQANGVPYPWVPHRTLNFMPYAVE